MHPQVQLLLKLEEIERMRMRKEEKRAKARRVENKIDPDILHYYRLRKERSGTGLAPIEDLVCQGCGMKYPETNLIIQKMGTEVIQCEFCGRIVYPAPKKKAQPAKTGVGKKKGTPPSPEKMRTDKEGKVKTGTAGDGKKKFGGKTEKKAPAGKPTKKTAKKTPMKTTGKPKAKTEKKVAEKTVKKPAGKKVVREKTKGASKKKGVAGRASPKPATRKSAKPSVKKTGGKSTARKPAAGKRGEKSPRSRR